MGEGSRRKEGIKNEINVHIMEGVMEGKRERDLLFITYLLILVLELEAKVLYLLGKCFTTGLYI